MRHEHIVKENGRKIRRFLKALRNRRERHKARCKPESAPSYGRWYSFLW